MSLNLKKHILFVFFKIVCISSFAQDFVLKSLVLDAHTSEKLPFANIMVSGHSIGTTSDIGGAFTLHLQQHHQDDTLVISYMGYETRKILVSEIPEEGVYLYPRAIELNTFRFAPGRERNAALNSFRNRDCFVPYDNSLVSGNYWLPHRPAEPTIQAMFFTSEFRKNAFIKEVRVHVRSFSTPALFRLRLFQADENNLPGDDLLSENIIVESSRRSELIKIDMEKYNLVLPENGLFIGVELLIIPENLYYAVLPDASDSIALYSPFLSFFPTRNENVVYWIYSGGVWQTQQLQMTTQIKNQGYRPAISLIISE